MPIPFTCPHCGHQTMVADEYIFQTGPCADCGKPITVAETAAVEMTAAPRQPAKFSRIMSTLAVILVSILGLLLCMGLLLGLLVSSAGEPHHRVQCSNNLKQIGLAMHNYHDTHGCFPPAYIADENGRPMHGWRVLLLPFLEQKPLYDQYNFDVPWDDPENLARLDNIPLDCYQCASDGTSNPCETNYMMIVGPGTVSDGPNSITLDDIQDGTPNTILVVETTGTGAPWFEPRDLDAQRMEYVINNPDEQEGIRSNHPGGVNVVLCNGSTFFLDDSTPKKQVELLSTIADGQPVEMDQGD